jgi:hypothetical protein
MLNTTLNLAEEIRNRTEKLCNEGSRIALIPTIYYAMTQQWDYFEQAATWGAVFASVSLVCKIIPHYNGRTKKEE